MIETYLERKLFLVYSIWNKIEVKSEVWRHHRASEREMTTSLYTVNSSNGALSICVALVVLYDGTYKSSLKPLIKQQTSGVPKCSLALGRSVFSSQ